jgi:hypothetical protein
MKSLFPSRLPGASRAGSEPAKPCRKEEVGGVVGDFARERDSGIFRMAEGFGLGKGFSRRLAAWPEGAIQPSEPTLTVSPFSMMFTLLSTPSSTPVSAAHL